MPNLKPHMKFRVTSITGSEEGRDVSAVVVGFEDVLNMALSSKDYGSNLDQLTIVVVTAFNEFEENERWADSQDKLAHVKNEFSGERILYLSFGVSIRRETVLNSSKRQIQEHLSQAICSKLTRRPRRVPAGLDYEALSCAIQTTLSGGCASAG
ncbi:hypothetical protein BH11PSE11_BH11PSE11_05160 [soil metagenome]